jgi:hypothetical protein
MTWIFVVIALTTISALSVPFGAGGPPYPPGDRLPPPQRALQDHERAHRVDEADELR